MAAPEPVTPAPVQPPVEHAVTAGLFTNIPDVQTGTYFPEFIEVAGPTIQYLDVTGYAWVIPG